LSIPPGFKKYQVATIHVVSSRSLPEITEPPQVVGYVERGATIKNGTIFKLKPVRAR
jgi:hypothetical protein